MIVDQHHRNHDYLRISLTDMCNLRCAYCMPDEDYPFMPGSRLMQPGEIEAISRVFAQLGVAKIRLTGGEPLARKDFGDILQQLAALPVTLALTTNGTLLHRHLGGLLDAGVRNLNISLDSLRPDTFFRITRRDKFSLTMNNIRMAMAGGMQVKINMVVMKGINDEEVADFVAWTKDEPVDIRFIEFMPFAANRWDAAQVLPKQELLERLALQYDFEPLEREQHATSQPYRVHGHAGTFAVISTMSAPFCGGCNRMRLTADGRMKNCLFSKDETDLLTSLRNGGDLEPLIRLNILGKAEKLGGQFDETHLAELQGEQLINRSMISIGG
jgi:GTP 3',8-cyclase